jgi:ATP-binding cassette subfamily B multidrug efflux pump
LGNIFKYLWESRGMVIGIILLLIVQAYCDLSLPQYTSDIVDIGIQQEGVDHIAMEKMRRETFEAVCLLLSQDQEQKLKDSYVQQEDGTYRRKKMERDALEELDGFLALPLTVLGGMESSGQMDAASLVEMEGAGQITREQLLALSQEAKAQMGDMSESILKQQAVMTVQAEYEALGWDLGDYQMAYLLKTGGKMLGITLVMVAAAVCTGFLASYTSAKVGRNLRNRIFRKVVSFSHGEMDQFSTASLITRSTNDVQQIQMVCVMLLRMVLYAPIIGIGGVVKVLNTRTGMGWIIALAVGLILVLVAVLVGVAMPKFQIMQTLVDRLNLVSREILTGIPVIRAFSRERYEEKRFAGANRDLMSTQLFTGRAMNFMMPAMMLIMNGITVLIVWNGAKGIDLGNLQVGDMMAFMTYTMQIVMAFLMITMISIMLPRAGVAAKRIEEVLEVEPAIRDKEQVKDKERDHWDGVVRFEDVSFQYPGADENAIEHISFTAEPGKTTAVIGSTGCGKSTLLHLIPRFYDVTQGRITMDGIDIRDLSQQKLRSLIGFVPQKGVLFSGDIASNIKFGGAFITEEQMREAAQIAQAMEFIQQKEEQFESAISQGGTNVSGGQKQRLSIARAIAKQPKVFLFDDSFSALDYKTDAMLRRALHEEISDAAVIIVAQRISTILHADQIMVLEDGKIAGMGTHEELLKNCGTYQEIARSQLSEAELAGSREYAGKGGM